jgi:hypothetical protein
MKVLRLFLIVLLGLSCWQASAQVYKHVDENGNVTFSDQKHPEATEVEISTTNTLAPPSSSAYPQSRGETDDEDDATDAPSYRITITAPGNDTTIPRGPGNFTVVANVTPALQGEHLLQLVMDGVPREEPNTYGTWPLTNIFRGEHKLEVSVISKSRETIATSSAVTVFVFRPSSNFTNNNSRPRPTPR